MLLVDEISKDYPTRDGNLAILQDCSFTLQRGESLAVLGPSGSGKSTLLHILGTLEPPSAGRFELDGICPQGLGERELARFRREKLGFVFQDHHLMPQCSALENVLLPFLAEGKTTPSQKNLAKDLLQRFGLGERINHRPSELSGGERQRVAIARALIRKPVLVLADEPTGNLDRSTAQSISELLHSLLSESSENAIILLLVTHDPHLAREMKFQKEIDHKTLRDLRP